MLAAHVLVLGVKDFGGDVICKNTSSVCHSSSSSLWVSLPNDWKRLSRFPRETGSPLCTYLAYLVGYFLGKFYIRRIRQGRELSLLFGESFFVGNLLKTKGRDTHQRLKKNPLYHVLCIRWHFKRGQCLFSQSLIVTPRLAMTALWFGCAASQDCHSFLFLWVFSPLKDAWS